jgi:hypothetical protein
MPFKFFGFPSSVNYCAATNNKYVKQNSLLFVHSTNVLTLSLHTVLLVININISFFKLFSDYNNEGETYLSFLFINIGCSVHKFKYDFYGIVELSKLIVSNYHNTYQVKVGPLSPQHHMVAI